MFAALFVDNQKWLFATIAASPKFFTWIFYQHIIAFLTTEVWNFAGKVKATFQHKFSVM